MGQELFGNMLEAIRDSFRHLANARPETWLLVAAAVIIFAFFLLRR